MTQLKKRMLDELQRRNYAQSTVRTFFLNVEVLSRVFRGKFKDALKEAFRQHQISFHGQLSYLAARV